MGNVNLTPLFKIKMANRPRTMGRYNASEAYSILHGWITPEQWLNPPEKTVKEMLTMWAGTGMHRQIEDLLESSCCEQKIEFHQLGWNDITLVGKADYLPPHHPDQVWEFKTSEKMMETAKPWQRLQTMLYCTMFHKEQGIIFQPLQDLNGIYLKELGIVNRDDTEVKEIIRKLSTFNDKVKSLTKSK